jgi:hypothetical protein
MVLWEMPTHVQLQNSEAVNGQFSLTYIFSLGVPLYQMCLPGDNNEATAKEDIK